MARTEAQYREVANVANDLYKAGIKEPSAPAIRKILVAKRIETGAAVGSPNSIQAELMRWRATERPADLATPAPRLGPSAVAEINKSIEAAAAQARDSLQPQLEMISQELKEVVESAKLCEIQLDEMTAVLAQRTRERDISEAQCQEQAVQVRALKDALEREQTLSAKLRVDVVRAEYSAAAEIVRAAEAKERESVLRDEIAQVRIQLSTEYESRTKFERRGDISETRLEAELKARVAAEARIDALVLAVGGIEATSARASAAEAAQVELRSQVAMLHKLLSDGTLRRPARKAPQLAPPAEQPRPWPNS